MRYRAQVLAAAVTAVLIATGCASVPYAPAIVPADFVTAIDNPFMPLVPGTRLVYEGTTDEGFEHEDYVVTRETKVIMGVTCVVVRDTVSGPGGVKEATDDWFAQDRAGNVWYFGEDSRDYKDGKVVSTKGSWIAGVDGALPGIVMKANPAVGDTYRQEYYRGHAEDMAKVDRLGLTIDGRGGSYTDVLRVLEWNPLEPGSYEYKYYAPRVGLIMESVRGSTERLELVEVFKEQR